MKRLIITAIPLMLTIFLSGCMQSARNMQTWVGQPESQVIAGFGLGAPDKTTKTDDGKTIITWDVRNGYGQIRCQMSFIISQNGYVESYSTNCP